MTIRQLSVFLENRHGTLVEVTELLAKENIDIRAMSLADTQDFGILRLIVNDPEAAKAALAKIGFVASVNEVTAVAIDDNPGALSEVIRVMAEGQINIEYMYAFLSTHKGNAYVVLRVVDNAHAAEVLTSKGITLVSEDDIKVL
ncbi:MAG: ACT domain-containing protein [Ruminococcaceae bacterium]|nr:ACT domain-containing protein [Oscillospiraceae bacterium]